MSCELIIWFSRYLEAYGAYPNYDRSKPMMGLATQHRQVPMSLPSHHLQHSMLVHHAGPTLGPSPSNIAQSHLNIHHDQDIINKRPRLYDSKAPIHQPLRIETQDVDVKKVCAPVS